MTEKKEEAEHEQVTLKAKNIEDEEEVVPHSNEREEEDDSSYEAPDGGWGWIVLIGAFIIYFVVLGTTRCQSVLLVPILNEFQADYSTVGWVSATFYLGMAISGVISAYMMAKYGQRTTAIVGGIIACLSSVVATFSPTILFFIITAGFFTGLGLGMSFVTAPVIIGLYFKKRRALATNIASMGGAVGTFAICPLNGFLVDLYNIRNYFLLMGGIFLHVCVSGALFRPVSLTITLSSCNKKGRELRTMENGNSTAASDQNAGSGSKGGTISNNEAKTGHHRQATAASIVQLATNTSYIMYCLSQLVFLGGYLSTLLFLIPFAEKELGIDKLQAPLIFSISACTELVSRIIFGILGDLKRVNRLLMLACVTLALAICSFIITFTSSFETLAVMGAVFGFCQGGFSGISFVVLADIVGIQLYGTALGVHTLINGIGTLAAPPLIGLAVDMTGKPSTGILIGSAVLLLGSILTFMIHVTIKLQKRRRNR